MSREYFLVCTQNANFGIKSAFIPIDIIDDKTMGDINLILTYGEELKEDFVQTENLNVYTRTDKYKNIWREIARFTDITDDSPVRTPGAIFPMNYELFCQETKYVVSQIGDIESVYNGLKNWNEIDGNPIRVVKSFCYKF